MMGKNLISKYREITDALKKAESLSIREGDPIQREINILKDRKKTLFSILYGKYRKGVLSPDEIVQLKGVGLYQIFEKIELRYLLKKYSSNSTPKAIRE